VTRADRFYVTAVIVAALALSSAPYVLGYAAQTGDVRFSGAVFDLPDYYSHLAKMQQGARGEWKYHLLFTPEDHAGAYLQTFYVALGQLARVTGLALPLIYQLARLAGGALALLASWRFVSALTPSRPVRRLALWLVAFSSGLGWLMQFITPAGPEGISATDFWLIDAYMFFSILTFPHFTFAIAILLEGLARWLRTVSTWRDVALIAALDFVLGLIHPYALLLALLIPALYAALGMLQRRRVAWQIIWALMAVGVAVSPVLIYDVWVFQANPVFEAWSAQNVTLSPPPQYYALGYGLVAALAVWGAAPALRRGGERMSGAVIWILVAFALAYLPWNLQRRFVEGAQTPICVLAAYALVYRLPKLLGLRPTPARRQARFWAINLTLVFAALTNLYMVAGFSLGALLRHPRLFIPTPQVAAVDWLGAHSSPDDTVLASEPVGSLIPARIGHRVVLGHWAETVNYRGKEAEVAAFFDATASEAERMAMLKRWGVGYVFHGPDERALGSFDPSRAPYLIEAFHAGDVVIYRVELP
jgi:hypothetical protein